MSRKQTVFVVGAGASNEVGLPIGSQLIDTIAGLLESNGGNKRRDSDIERAIFDYAQQNKINYDVLLNAASRIARAMPQAKSIDNFINDHKSDKWIEVCGKLAIVRAVLAAEQSSSLYVDSRVREGQLNYLKLKNTWFHQLQFHTLGGQKEDLIEKVKCLTFIIFNYDRCVENFLFYSFQSYYGLSEIESAEICNEIAFYHPYGVVGALPWQSMKESVPYGGQVTPALLLQSMKGIKTFTEGVDPDNSHIVSIQKSIAAAQVVVFLGFAFHPLNLQLLTPKDRKTFGVPGNVYGTAFGMSASNRDHIVEELQKVGVWGNASLNIRNDLKCAELLQEFERRIT